ncbi:hypothetical protein [Kordiimonas gwangyangensis]|uniref:hypothetical protein n=1 Tax=Kordiimonas gwangyangensis TaxID=288022 RepID=UPI000380AD55|nr:hypothetical protein [Kordiimonas gwangyangensis]
MKRVLIGGLVVGAAAVGAYAYADHRFEAQILAAIESRNANPDVDGHLSFSSLDTSFLGGTANVTDLLVTNKVSGTEVTRIKDGMLTFDVGFGGNPGALTGFSFDGVVLTEPAGTVTVSHLSADGLNINPMNADEMESLAGAKIGSFKLTDMRAKGMAPGPMEFALNKVNFETSNDGDWLEEFLIEGLNLDMVMPDTGMPLKAQLKQMQLVGGNIGAIRGLMDVKPSENGGAPTFGADAMRVYMQESLNYMGIEKATIAGLEVNVPGSVTMSLTNMSVDDITRKNGIALGGRAKIENFRLSNLASISPQAAQILGIAGLDQLVMNAASVTSYDESTSTFTSKGHLHADQLLNLNMNVKIDGVDLDQMTKLIGEAQERQIAFVKKMEDPNMTPEQAAEYVAESQKHMLDVYFGYYSGFNMNMTLEDIGGLERGLRVYSAMSGLPVEQLRMQFGMAATQNLMMLLGANTPEELEATINGFMGNPSSPVIISLESKQDMRTVNPEDVDQSNWHEFVKVDIKAAN